MKNLFCASLLCAGLLAAGSVAAQDDIDDRWYLSGDISSVFADADRNLSDLNQVRFGVGKYFTPNLSLDLSILYADAEVEREAFGGLSGDFEHLGLDLTARMDIMEGDSWQPYLLGGIAILDRDDPFSSDTSAALSAGIGVRTDITANLGLRSEASYRLDFDDNDSRNTALGTIDDVDDYGDWLLTFGMTYKLGPAPTAAPAPAEPTTRDSDGDGVIDARDRCPDTPAGVPVDANGCPLDSDGDGVPDYKDKCPDTPRGVTVDEDGCPVTLVIDLGDVHFEFDKSTLVAESRRILDRAVGLLEEYPGVDVEVAGHTDAIGTVEYNQGLSERRARAVYDYLTANGVDASRMTTRGYSENDPIATNETAEGRALNRRTELRVDQ